MASTQRSGRGTRVGARPGAGAVLTVTLLLVSPALTHDHGSSAAQTAPEAAQIARAAAVVTVARAEPAEIVIRIPVTGSLVAREEVMVNPHIAGRIITALHADIGDHVETGALLAELERDSLEVQLEQAQAEQARAKAAIAQAEAQVALSETRLADARRTYERNVKLRENETVSQTVLDQTETAYLTARNSLKSAQAGLLVAQTQLQQADAQIRLAQLNLSYARITAPVAGTVAQRNARIGAVAVAGAQPMFSIISDDEVEMEAEVLETEINLLGLNAPVTLNVSGVGEVTGRVRLIPPTVDPRTRLARIRISLPQGAGLRPGVFARGHVEARRFQALTVPVSAVLSDAGTDFVLVVGADNRLERREIRIGAVWEGRQQILSGLKSGELVVRNAGPFFQPGDLVQPVLDDTVASVGEARK